MSNRKTKKQKQQLEQRKSRIKELQDLKEKKLQLERQISEQKAENFKQLNIRNLKIFGNTCNFVAPFVITAGLTVGLFKMFGGGLPFHRDEVTKYKLYDLDYQSNVYVAMDESYRTDGVFNNLSSNKLTIYTPWKYEDNQYIRYKREYDVDKLSSLELFNAILEEDYSYIEENMKDYKEEIQTVNRIDETEKTDYFFDASLHMLDKNDTLKYNETDSKNISITVTELIFVLGIGALLAHYRNFDYLYELSCINDDYNYEIETIKPMQEELALTNEKILSLSRIKEGKISDK